MPENLLPSHNNEPFSANRAGIGMLIGSFGTLGVGCGYDVLTRMVHQSPELFQQSPETVLATAGLVIAGSGLLNGFERTRAIFDRPAALIRNTLTRFDNFQNNTQAGFIEYLRGVNQDGESLPLYLMDKAIRCAIIFGFFGTMFWVDNKFVDHFMHSGNDHLPKIFWEFNKAVADHPLETIGGFTVLMTTLGVLSSLRRFHR